MVKRMITKNRKGKSQIHLFSSEKLYNDFKENVKQINKATDKDVTISEILRTCIYKFNNSAEFQKLIISNIKYGGAEL